MATAGEGSYEGGRGGGKFRKKPFRRSQTTPYDRPPNALRNPRNGWLSKVVDPASKLIAASAHKFFGSVFRKRLPPPEVNEEPRHKFQEAVPTNTFDAQEQAISDGGNSRNSSDGSSFSKLELILKQKTFTRHEIDRLTTLLQSRTVDLPVEDKGKRSEVKFSEPPDSCDRQAVISNNPVQENEIESHRFLEAVSTSTRVLQEDASPAELAKAYMGSRPSKVSPSTLGLRSPAFREDSTLPSNFSYPSKSPIMSIVPKSPSPVEVSENGFMIPRFRGRSALYNMARTPYSRVNPTTTIKAVTSTPDFHGGPSSSQSALVQYSSSGSKQGLLKRRSSVLESDIGSIGPIRRIRQKPNLLPSRGLGTPVGGVEKPHSLGGSKHKFSTMPTENGDNSVLGISFAHVPSQSSEMAEKILQQLDKLTPPRKEKSCELKLSTAMEKPPAKLIPTMLRGQALKSLESLDSSKIWENVQDNNKISNVLTACVPDAQDSTFQKPDKVENGPTKFSDGTVSLVKNVDATVSSKDATPSVKTADSSLKHSSVHPPSQKKQAFQMSAHEVYLELDDDYCPNGHVNPLVESREKLGKSLVDGKIETVTVEPVGADSSCSKESPSSSMLNKNGGAETSETHVAEKNSSFTFPIAPVSSMTVHPVVFAPQPSSTFDKAVPPKEPNAASTVVGFDAKNVNKFTPITFSSLPPVVSEPLGPKFGCFSGPQLESSSSSALVSFGAKIAESSQDDANSTLQAGDSLRKTAAAFSSPVSTSIPAAGIFSFGAPANDSKLNNGLLASSCSMFPSPSQPPDSNITNQSASSSSTFNFATATNDSMSATVAIASQSSSLSISTTTVPSFNAAPIFAFGSSVAPSTSMSPVSITSVAESTDKEAYTKQETSFGNLASTSFGGATPAATNTGNNILGFNGSTSSNANNQSLGGTSSKTASTGTGIFDFSGSSFSNANNQSPGSTLFGSGSGALVSNQPSSSPADTGIASSTLSKTLPFGLSASPPVFGMTGAAPLSSGSSLFGSSTPAKLFGSSSGGLSSSVSLSEPNTSVSTSNLFSSNWQTNKPPAFGSALNPTAPSIGFSFGGSSASAAGSNSAPLAFGSSMSSSSTSMFPFNSSASNASLSSFPSSQTVFGNSNPVIPFGSATGNNDQMNPEDSMAEDTVQASTPAFPVLGQSVMTPSPSPSFVFGAPAPSGVSPFQFGGQQNPVTPQTPSSFQDSGSLDFGAGGSFSLGTGGNDKSNRRTVKVKHLRRKK